MPKSRVKKDNQSDEAQDAEIHHCRGPSHAEIHCCGGLSHIEKQNVNQSAEIQMSTPRGQVLKHTNYITETQFHEDH